MADVLSEPKVVVSCMLMDLEYQVLILILAGQPHVLHFRAAALPTPDLVTVLPMAE